MSTGVPKGIGENTLWWQVPCVTGRLVLKSERDSYQISSGVWSEEDKKGVTLVTPEKGLVGSTRGQKLRSVPLTLILPFICLVLSAICPLALTMPG
jgi:hypothetical protein